MPGKYKTLINNTIIFAIGSIGSRIITFLLVPLYTNVLSTSEFGTSDFVMTISSLIVPIVSLTIHEAVLRFGLSEQIDKGQVALNSFLVLLVGQLCLILLSPLFSLNNILSDWKWYLVAIIFTNSLNNIALIFAKSKDQNKLYAFASLLQTLVLAIVNILLLVVFKCGVRGYLIAIIISSFIPAIVVMIKTHMLADAISSKLNKKLLKEMIFYSLPLVFNSLSWWVLNSSDRLMLEYYLDVSELGLFAAASKIPALLTVVTYIFLNAWTISSIKEYESEQDKTFYSSVFSFFSLSLFIIASIIIGLIKPFMSLYVGDDFFSAWRFTPFLILGAVFYAYSCFFGAIYDAAKKNVSVAVTTMIGAFVNIIVNFLLIPRIGVLGASISTFIGYVIIGVYRMIDSKRYFSFPIRYSNIFLNSCVLLIQTILVTLDFHVYLTSIISLILLILLNFNSIKSLYDIILYHLSTFKCK